MKDKANKRTALLYSAGMLPGSGEFYLGYRLLGMVVMLVSLTIFGKICFDFTVRFFHEAHLSDPALSFFARLWQALGNTWYYGKMHFVLLLLALLFTWIISLINIAILTPRR